MYYLDVVLKLKKKSFFVKQVNSLDNLLLKLENKNEIYDKIVVDLDFITQSELNEFLGNYKIDLLIVTNNPEEIDENLRNTVEMIFDKSQKDEFLEKLSL